MPPQQGDQIGRIFAQWMIVFWPVTRKLEKEPTFLGYFIWLYKFLHQFRQNMVWDTFWANFSQTYLVTLLRNSNESILCRNHARPVSSFYLDQGDQIGQFSSFWRFFVLGNFKENYVSSKISGILFHTKSCTLKLAKYLRAGLHFM
jgi:hypothetical protein